jgi:hypothetical protein
VSVLGLARRIALVGLAVVLVAGAGAVVYRIARGDSSRSDGTPGEQPTVGAGAARVLLNEIVFQPVSGQPQWVELVNTGGASAPLAGYALENHAGERFALPSRLTLPAGSVLLVRFDGRAGSDADGVHAAPTTFLSPDGFVQLAGPQGRLDRIAWGDNQAAAANLSRGGYSEERTPGMSLGRVPRTTTSDPLDWVPYAPDQATPGQANPQPGVEILVPVDGAIVSVGEVSLSWYTVAGAVRYRVQLAIDSSFGSPLVDRTVDAPPVAAPSLAPGSYVWRVQAISAEGTTAEYSRPSALTVRPARKAASGRTRSLFGRLLPVVLARPPQTADDELPTVFDVPLIRQHKDTRMLLIETRRDTGQHAWDVDHQDLDRSDPADNMNCASACIAMLSGFYGARLSQDRINYEVFSADEPGPQGDVNWGRGYNRERMVRAMAFAFGVPPRIDPPLQDLEREALWRARRDARMPAIACKNRHCVAVVGFGGIDDLLVINDPGARGTYLAPLGFLRDATVFVMARPTVIEGKVYTDSASASPMLVRPRSDEPEISTDSDGDGVVDFDEIRRFKTNPRLKDTDDDELPDKEDIKASVHDPRHGFAYGGSGRDFDGDGTMMELDDDADDGGCLDGWEDENKNGRFDRGPSETNNFEKNDDPCIRGTYELKNDEQWEEGAGSSVHSRMSLFMRHVLEISLRPLEGNRLDGKAKVRFDSSTTTTTRTGSSVCEESTATVPVRFLMRLTGEADPRPDGSVELTIRLRDPAAPAPPIRLDWKNSCSTPPAGRYESPSQLHYWPLPTVTLVNGVYDHVSEKPTERGGYGASGKTSTRIHLEQKRAGGGAGS